MFLTQTDATVTKTLIECVKVPMPAHQVLPLTG